MSGLSMAAGAATLNLGMIAWTGATTTYILFLCALFGLATVVLAIRGTMRPLFFLWSLVVTIVLVKGYFLGSYHFESGDVNTALYLIGGSLIALLGSWFRDVTRRRCRRPPVETNSTFRKRTPPTLLQDVEIVVFSPRCVWNGNCHGRHSEDHELLPEILCRGPACLGFDHFRPVLRGDHHQSARHRGTWGDS